MKVIRLDFLSAAGRTAAKEYGVWLIPATVLLDVGGQVIQRQTGLLNSAEITAHLKSLHRGALNEISG